jgi:hypothetical protein
MADFGPLGGVKVTGFISPTDTNDSYAVIDPLYGVDGLRNYSGGTSELSNIPALRRRPGMIVGINDGAQYFKLKPIPWSFTLSDWVEIFFFTGTTNNTFSGLTDTYVNAPQTGDLVIYSGNTLINISEKNVLFSASTIGQTLFSGILTPTPIKKENSKLFVNGVRQTYGQTKDFIITGGTDLVWVSNKHQLDTGDSLEITYL